MVMEVANEAKQDLLYMEVADRIESLIAKETFKIGDKLLSVRAGHKFEYCLSGLLPFGK